MGKAFAGTAVVALLALLASPVSAAAPPPAAPVVFSIHTSKPVVFITIDDGWYRSTGFLTDFRRAGVPASLFLVDAAAEQDYGYFRSLQAAGAVIEDHTLSHPVCSGLTPKEQRHQICATARIFATEFGRRPTLFRPPYGDYDLATQRAAAACGMHALVLWDVTVNSGRLTYAVGDHLRPGDIVLMHFTKDIRTNFAATLAAVRQAGLHPRLLENYL